MTGPGALRVALEAVVEVVEVVADAADAAGALEVLAPLEDAGLVVVELGVEAGALDAGAVVLGVELGVELGVAAGALANDESTIFWGVE